MVVVQQILFPVDRGVRSSVGRRGRERGRGLGHRRCGWSAVRRKGVRGFVSLATRAGKYALLVPSK